MRGGPVLDREDVKCIFANIEDILHVHERIMVRELHYRAMFLRTCLQSILNSHVASFIG